MLAWPGALNMLSIIVQGMGLQYISASVSQMIAGEHESCQMQQACKASSPVLSFVLVTNWKYKSVQLSWQQKL